jgi:hypothetical protein
MIVVRWWVWRITSRITSIARIRWRTMIRVWPRRIRRVLRRVAMTMTWRIWRWIWIVIVMRRSHMRRVLTVVVLVLRHHLPLR